MEEQLKKRNNKIFFFTVLLLCVVHGDNADQYSELQLLLTFKSSLKDPTSSLSSWSSSSTSSPCNWTGITCSDSISITSIDLHSFNLSGEVSSSVCSLKKLSSFNLANNFFNQPIPLHFSECIGLQSLNLSNNFLWGTLPDQVYQMGSLKVLDLSFNKIEGNIPVGLGSLQQLQVLNLGSNLFSGILHSSLFKNLSELVVLDVSQNPSLVSEIPQEISNLKKLKRLFMRNSGLFGGIPDAIVGLTDLEDLNLSKNNLTGRIPIGFGVGVKLVSVDLSENNLLGSFPTGICYGKSLIELNLHSNSFNGALPSSLMKCQSLERFQIQDNGFAGVFPSRLWSLPNIRIIRAENNWFSGELPDTFTVSSRLEQVQVDNNSFTGKLPSSLGKISTLYRFSASLNRFHGNLPENFCDSPAMSIINLSHNSLSGIIPELTNCKRLVSLSLADNSFIGEIPDSLARLPVLTYIDLSKNNLSGGIPAGLQNLKLALFNVSFNQLSGSVPSSLITGLPASFLEGNPGLCGPGLPNLCNAAKDRRNFRLNGLILAVISVASAVSVLLLGGGVFAVCRSYQMKNTSFRQKSLFFQPLNINIEDVAMSLNDESIIGRGPFGDVYVIQLPDGEPIAVKKLSNSRNIPFSKVKAEVKKLAKARHKNITKVFGFCYSEDSILVIHEYLEKGSLGDLLWRPDPMLDWKLRMQIAFGVAQGLLYLHKDYIPHLLHRNIKSNNILIDEDFQAKITGFAFDHIVGEVSFKSSLASELAPLCYMAPEHSCGKGATEQMDVYSFGVVLLELITGRPAMQPEPRESLDIIRWVRRKTNMVDGNSQILDPMISSSYKEKMLEALDLALRCTSVTPEKRPTMDEIVRAIQSLS